MNIKKVSSIIAGSVLTLMFTIPAFASNSDSLIGGVDPLKGVVDPEKVIIVDAPDQDPKDVKPNLVANYEADLEDLINQLKELDSEYQQLIKEVETVSPESDKGKEIKETIEFLERSFKSAAEGMLESRYTDDKSAIRPEIIQSLEFAEQVKKR